MYVYTHIRVYMYTRRCIRDVYVYVYAFSYSLWTLCTTSRRGLLTVGMLQTRRDNIWEGSRRPPSLKNGPLTAFTRAQGHVYVCTYTCVYAYTYMRILICVCKYAYTYICMRAFLHSARTARAQRAHSTNYYGDYPGNNPENHPPAESCTINSKLKNSNI